MAGAAQRGRQPVRGARPVAARRAGAGRAGRCSPAALKEEVQRAFVLHRFDQHLGGARLGLVLYSLVFGTGHIIQGYDVAIVTALLGLAWGTVFLWRRSAGGAGGQSRGIQCCADSAVRGVRRADARALLVVAADRRADAARRHAADLRLRRGAVCRLPAVAVVRPRRLVRERVPAVLRERARRATRCSPPRSSSRPTETGLRRNFGTIGSRAAVGAVLRGRRRRRPRRPRRSGSTVAADGYSAPYISGGLHRVGRLRPAGPRCSPGARRGASSTAARACRRDRTPPSRARPSGLGTPLLFYMYVAPAIRARHLGVRRRGVRARVARACATAGRSPALVVLGALAGADGHGARTGRVHRRRAGHRLRRGPCCADSAAGAPSARRLAGGRGGGPGATCRRRPRTSRSTAASGRRGSSAAR
ncbi:MAG: CPBP family intramembrane metalloprotease [Ignavibacteriales bacterium]|nr:CPBP family intramembrane metalloprotease [Ignavibacteriales bacterium]